MKSQKLINAIIANSIDLLEYNPVTTPFYIICIAIECCIKSVYGIIVIYLKTEDTAFAFLQNAQNITLANYVILAYLATIILAMSGFLLTQNNERSNWLKTFISKFIAASLVCIHNVLMIPILAILIQTIRLGILNGFQDEIKFSDLIIALISSIIWVMLFLFTETIFVCFFPNPKIPWSKPTQSIDVLRVLSNVSITLLLIFDEGGSALEYSLLTTSSVLNVIQSLVKFAAIPYYNQYVDAAQLVMYIVVGDIYLFSSLMHYLKVEECLVSFLILYTFHFIPLLTAIFKLRGKRISRLIIKKNKSSGDYSKQLVQLFRIIRKAKSQAIIELQEWVLAHKIQCSNNECICQKFNLDDIIHFQFKQVQQSLNQEPSKQAQPNIPSQSVDLAMKEVHENRQELIQQKKLNQDFYMSQFFFDDIFSVYDKNIEDKLSKKIKKVILQLLKTEMNERSTFSTQIEFLKLCMIVFLNNEMHQAFFQVLLIQTELPKLSYRQLLIIQYLKKSLINNQMNNEKVKKDIEKIQLVKQLKFEKNYNRFIMEIEKITEMNEELWSQSLNKNYKILSMAQLMNNISDRYLALWKKFQEIDESEMNAELMLIFARFCDFIMCFELEAENYYLKGTSLLNSLKLEVQKGGMMECIEGRIKTQEQLLCVECQPKCIDKITFANQKFLQVAGYKKEDIPQLKYIIPSSISQVHDQLISNFLMSQSKKKKQIRADTWLKVKNGYIIPVQVIAHPQISLKHQLRFIGIIKPRKEIALEDKVLHTNSLFTMLVNQFGHINAVSKECHDIFNINMKLLDNGITIQHLFKNLDFDNSIERLNGEEYEFNKENVHQAQLQLDIQPQTVPENEVQHIQFYSTEYQDLVKGFNFKDIMKKLSITDYSQKLMMKLYVEKIQLGNSGTFIYEVNAIPVYQGYEKALTVGSRQLAVTTNQGLYEELKEDTKPFSQLQGTNSEFQQDYFSLSSMTSSSSNSKFNKDYDQVRNIKEITTLKEEPPIIKKLSRSMHLFFIIMLVTAVTLLSVNIKDKVDYVESLVAVQDAFKIQYYISNIRLRFLFLYIMSNHYTVGNFTQEELLDISLVQKQLGEYAEDFRNSLNQLNQAVKDLDEGIQNLFDSPGMFVTEVSTKGALRNISVSFEQACQELIEKSDVYSTSSLNELMINRSIIGLKYGQDKTNYTLDTDQVNAFFIIENTANSISTQGNIIQNEFSNEVELIQQSTVNGILIITSVCLAIVVISGFLMMPVLFIIDNNLADSIKSWMFITSIQKEEQIKRIQYFRYLLDTTDDQNQKNGQGKRNQKFEDYINQGKQQTMNQQKSIKPQIEKKSHKKKVKKHVNNEDILEAEDEEQKEEFKFQKVAGSNMNKGIVQQSQHKSDQHLQEKIIDLDEESDDDKENEQNDKQSKDYNQIDFSDTEVDKIHKFQQQNNLNRYIFSRKIKMAIVVSIFSMTLCGLYVGSYLLGSNIYQDSQEDFDDLQVISDRAPCLAKSFFLLFYTYVRNETIIIDGIDSLSKVIPQCLAIEDYLREMKRFNKQSYVQIASIMGKADSNQFCNLYVESLQDDGVLTSRSDMDDCQQELNGTLSQGLSNNIQRIYQYISQKNVRFQNKQITKNLTFIHQELYDDNFQEFLFLYFIYLGPVLDEVQVFYIKSLYVDLQKNFTILIIMISTFLAFILTIWFLSIKIMIGVLKQTVQRSKIYLNMFLKCYTDLYSSLQLIQLRQA